MIAQDMLHLSHHFDGRQRYVEKGLVATASPALVQVVRHEHHNIFVVNTQTYETYRFTVGDNVMLSFDRAPSDLSEARRTAIAFLAQSQTKGIPRR